MRVLGIAGSPRRGGNTDLLLEEVLKGAAGKGAEVKTITLARLKIAPCQHCDACLETGRCRIQDDMQGVYDELEWADRIVLAAPIHFMGLSAQMKAMIDRCQCLWARKYVLKVPPLGDDRQNGERGTPNPCIPCSAAWLVPRHPAWLPDGRPAPQLAT